MKITKTIEIIITKEEALAIKLLIGRTSHDHRVLELGLSKETSEFLSKIYDELTEVN